MESAQSHCLNCHTEFSPNAHFCSNCGQKRSPAKVPFKDIFMHFVEDYFTVDHKITKSVFWLLYKPGYLTLEYISGRRASYIAPVRVFLFCSILFFIIESYNFSLGIDSGDSASSFFHSEPGDTVKISDISSIAFTDTSHYTLFGDCLNDYLKNPDSVRLSFRVVSPDDFISHCHSGTPRVEKFIIRKLYKIEQGGLGSFQSFLLSAASKIIFLMVPLFALLMKLVYFRRDRYYFEHFIFAIHLHTFLFILFSLIALLDMMNIIIPWELILLGILVYFVLALRKVYQQKWAKTIIKSILLSFLYLVVFLPFGAILTLIYAFVAL